MMVVPFQGSSNLGCPIREEAPAPRIITPSLEGSEAVSAWFIMDPDNILFDDLANLQRVRSHFGLRRQSAAATALSHVR